MRDQTKQDGAFAVEHVVSEVTETLKLFSDKSSSLAWLELSVVKSVLELLIFQPLPPECWVIGIYPHAWLNVVHEIKLRAFPVQHS